MARLLGMTRFWNYITDWIETRVHLRPEKDITLDLGASDYRWRNAYVGGFLNLGPGTTLTISSNAITVTGSRHLVDAPDAAEDLNTINGGSTGDLLVLSSVTYTRVPTLKDAAAGGNLMLAGDFALTDTRDRILLVRYGDNWYEISRSDNA